jgi:hypothetical protein
MVDIPRTFFYKMVDCLNRGLTVEQAKKEFGL